MQIKKRNIILLAMLIFIGVTAIMFVSNLKKAQKRRDMYVGNYDLHYSLGKIEKVIYDSMADETMAPPYSNQISEEDMFTITEALNVTEAELGDMIASEIEVRLEQLEWLESCDIEVDDEDVWNLIEMRKESVEAASNYSDFLSFIEGIEMTEDAYWESLFDLYKYDILQKQ